MIYPTRDVVALVGDDGLGTVALRTPLEWLQGNGATVRPLRRITTSIRVLGEEVLCAISLLLPFPDRPFGAHVQSVLQPLLIVRQHFVHLPLIASQLLFR